MKLRLLRARAGGVAPTILFASVYLIFPSSVFLFSAPPSINISFAASVLRGKGQQLAAVGSLSFLFLFKQNKKKKTPHYCEYLKFETLHYRPPNPPHHLVPSLPDVFRRASRRLLHALLPLPPRRRRSTDEPVVVIQHTPSAVRVLHTPTVWPRQSAEVLLAAFLLCSMLMTMNYCLIEVILIVVMNCQ